jgi:hypothetical protein
MTEAEFERRISGQGAPVDPEPVDAGPAADPEPAGRASSTSGRTRASRPRAAKPRRVQRMFAIEEDVDKKLWLYAIHMGKDRSEVVNDLLKPVVASMVLYDSRDRRGGRSSDTASDRGGEAEGDAA